jgi:serine/threonine-protein kinase HipA
MTTDDGERCLCCGKPLGKVRPASQWHTACARFFFGSADVPAIELGAGPLESWALLNIRERNPVTGVQKKMSLHLADGQSGKRLTLVGYPAGFILKPATPEYPELPELEHATMSLAEAAGLSVVPHALVKLEAGDRAYITRRIDRVFPAPSDPRSAARRKIPMEDSCQLSLRLTEDKYKGSYEQCGKIVAKHSSRAGIDLAEYFSLLLFSFAAGNSDLHLKNVSLYRPSAGWILSPAYDLLSTALIIPEDAEEMALTLNGKKSKLKREDFLACAASLGVNGVAAGRLADRAAASSERLIGALGSSFISENLREQFAELISARCARLARNRENE